MCGINGVFGLENIDEPVRIIQDMNESMLHRGPDAGGHYLNKQLVLGQRRLSIIDTSDAANQPFYSEDQSLVLVYNGEIYNYLELRAKLKDYPFKTQSDTEVIIAAYQKWGIACIHRFNGMFSFALWDEKLNKLFVVRDRLGIKPLYYAHIDDQFVFSSELRSLLSSGLVDRKLDVGALHDYMRYQTVHAPYTLVEGVHMLLPGHYIEISDNEYNASAYWQIAEDARVLPHDIDEETCKKEIRNKLEKSVELRMRADVPSGAFLSGGIDSSIIVGLMSQQTDQKIDTFNVSFDESEFSERIYAEQIAKKFNTRHHDIRLKPDNFLENIPNALSATDHPSGDGPNTFIVSKETKARGITMAMSGLGGDELFAGYDVFKHSVNLEGKKWLASFPKGIRTLGANLLSLYKPSVASEKIKMFLTSEYMDLDYSYPIHRQIFPDKKIRELCGENKLSPNRVFEIVSGLWNSKMRSGELEVLSRVSTAEVSTYMQNVLLRDSDQMSMANSLELRVPFLDHDLVEYALGIPDKIKYPHSPKKLLVSAFDDLLPDEIVNRPKMGFTLPWKHWMKGELKSMCKDALKSLESRPYFVDGKLSELYDQFEKGNPLITWSRVWPLVVLEHWMQENGVE